MIYRCLGCMKKPDEIEEYINGATDEGITSLEYVQQEEGTYNPRNGAFLCTDCYIERGMPLGVAAPNFSESELEAMWSRCQSTSEE